MKTNTKQIARLLAECCDNDTLEEISLNLLSLAAERDEQGKCSDLPCELCDAIENLLEQDREFAAGYSEADNPSNGWRAPE